MLSVRDEKGGIVAAWSFATTLGLVAVSVLPWALGLATVWSGGVAVAGGLWFIVRAGIFLRAEGRDAAARQLFLCSIAYLPLVLGALVADRIVNF
jgi:protoheme IX farnesyltransferase